MEKERESWQSERWDIMQAFKHCCYAVSSMINFISVDELCLCGGRQIARLTVLLALNFKIFSFLVKCLNRF